MLDWTRWRRLVFFKRKCQWSGENKNLVRVQLTLEQWGVRGPDLENLHMTFASPKTELRIASC